MCVFMCAPVKLDQVSISLLRVCAHGLRGGFSAGDSVGDETKSLFFVRLQAHALGRLRAFWSSSSLSLSALNTNRACPGVRFYSVDVREKRERCNSRRRYCRVCECNRGLYVRRVSVCVCVCACWLHAFISAMSFLAQSIKPKRSPASHTQHNNTLCVRLCG